MKKKILMILSCLVLLIGGTISLVIILKDDKPLDEKPITEVEVYQLKRPLNLKFEGYTFSWDQVENADSYMVYIDEMEYIVSSNFYDLSQTVKEGSVISVKALGKNQYKNSVKSLEMIFRTVIDDNEVSIIKTYLRNLLNKYLFISDNFENKLDIIAKRIYLNGITSDNAKKIFKEIDLLLEQNQKIVKFDKINTIIDIIDYLSNILSLNINEYGTVVTLFSFGELFCDVYKNNQSKLHLQLFDTKYFSDGSIISNMDALESYLMTLSSFDLQKITSLIHYYNVYKKQINNFRSTLKKIDVENINVLYNDIMTLKNFFCDILINQMPELCEFEGFKKIVLTIYNMISDGYLEEKLTSIEIEDYFDNLYTINEYYLSFLNYLEDNDYKVIITRVLAVYKSISNEDKENIKDVLLLFNPNSESNVLEIVKKHFNLNFGDYDLELSKEFKNQMIKIFDQEEWYKIVYDLLEYFEVGNFVSTNENIINEVVNYLVGLLPDELKNVDSFTNYYIEILNKMDYQKYISFDFNKLINKEDQSIILDNLFDVLVGKIEFQQFYEIFEKHINYNEIIKIDGKLFLKDLINQLKSDASDLAIFIENIRSLEDISIQNILNLMNIDGVIQIDYIGFKNHLFELMDVYFEEEVVSVKINQFVDGVLDEINQKVSKLDKYASLIEFFKKIGNEEITEDEIGSIYQDESLDFLSLFILMDHLNIKYAKFQVNHFPIYENGLEFDMEVFKENLFNSFIYLYYGIHSYPGHDVTKDSVEVVKQVVELAENYQNLLDIIEHYSDFLDVNYYDFDISKLLSLYHNQDDFDNYIQNIRNEVDYLYNSIKFLCSHLPIQETVDLNYSLVELIKSYGYEEISEKLLEIVSFIDQGYLEFYTMVEKMYFEFEQKENALVSLYSNLHYLIDPIEAYILELKDIYFVDGNLSDDDIIDIVSQILMNKNKINEFYKKDVIINIGSNLDVLFGKEFIDFKASSLEIIFYGDLINNRINAYNAVSTVLDLTQKVLDIVPLLKEFNLIVEEIEIILSDTNLSYSEKVAIYRDYYVKLENLYQIIKNNAFGLASKYDQFILAGIDELTQQDLEYSNRKEEFLITREVELLFKYFDEFIINLNVELPKKDDLDFNEIIIQIFSTENKN